MHGCGAHEVSTLTASLAEGGQVRLVVLPGFAEILPWPIGPTRWFADELSDVVRVVACLDRMPNLRLTGEPRFISAPVLHGVETLPVAWDA